MASYVSEEATDGEDPRAVFLALLADVEVDPYNAVDVVECKADWIARFDAAVERKAVESRGNWR